MKPNRIHIIGITGSGKTYIANELSKRLKIKSYDLDDLFFKRKYDIKKEEKERARLLNKIINKKKWIIEGVYTDWAENSIKRSDTIIWLDRPFIVLFYNLVKRYILRFGRNKETLKDLILLLRYAWRYKEIDQKSGYYDYLRLIKEHKKNFVKLRNKREIDEFLNSLKL